MSSVLRKLKMDGLIDRFEEEKISSDIVCQLSLHELKELGLQNRSEIMTLRIACVTFGAEQPMKFPSALGPPAFDIPKSVLECYLEEDFPISEIANMMSVSESTIYRRMRLYGLSKLQFSNISDEELDHQLHETTKEFPRCGEVLLKQLLYEKGVKVQRMRLRDSLHRVDGLGVQERTKGRLQRRVYSVKSPNELWHVDTNHKLIRWNFVIVGGIDGFSRLPVMLECTDNNSAATILRCFLDAVHEFGIPSRVLSDKGLENVGTADFMIENRGAGGNRGSMITGKSTHNQRIERLWRDVYEGVLGFYYDLFYFMEDNQILDPLSDVHLAALHFIYLPTINEKLKIWQNAWSRHRIRTIRSSPLRLWLAGQMQDPGPDVTMLDLNNYGVEGIVTDDEVRDNRPVFCPLVIEIDEPCKTELYSKTYTSFNHGIEDFQTAAEVTQRYKGI